MRDQLGIISRVPRGATAELPPAAGGTAGTSLGVSSSAWARGAAQVSLRAGTAITVRGRAATRRAALAGRRVRVRRACMVPEGCRSKVEMQLRNQTAALEGEGAALRVSSRLHGPCVSRSLWALIASLDPVIDIPNGGHGRSASGAGCPQAANPFRSEASGPLQPSPAAGPVAVRHSQ